MSYTNLSGYDNTVEKSLLDYFKDYTSLTNEQVKNLTNVRKENGSLALNLESEEEKDISFIYETIGMVKDFGYSKALDFVKNNANKISEKSILNTFIFEKEKNKFKEETKKMRTKIKINNSGIYKCIKCGSNETSYTAKQLRSGDEGSDYMVACNSCGAFFVR
jgi:DNA-directed RNA polymerase subunit M/transcription elongation factor TFIIS